jgi:hypothetical protein
MLSEIGQMRPEAMIRKLKIHYSAMVYVIYSMQSKYRAEINRILSILLI